MSRRSILIVVVRSQLLRQSPHLADLLHHAGIVLLQGLFGLQSDRICEFGIWACFRYLKEAL